MRTRFAALAALALGVAACDEPANFAGPDDQPRFAKGGVAAGFRTTAPAQAQLLVDGELLPIATAGDVMPGSGERLAGIPDGIGSFGGKRYMQSYLNHEISGGSKVSKFMIDTKTGTILDHEYTIDGSEGYNRLCSASWNDAGDGFPGGYFFTGEESSDGIQLAIDAQGNVTELPWIGYYAHEQQIAVPGFHGSTVIINFDDSGTGGGDASTEDANSELYMYVADNSWGVLNGAGQLYVFTSDEAANVGALTEGQTITGHWIPVPEDVALDFGGGSPAINDWVDDPAHDAFDFTRLEDGFYDKVSVKSGEPAMYFFDTGDPTLGAGGQSWDRWGSIYRMAWDDAKDPTGATHLTMVARSEGPTTGWASPDNGDMNADGVIMLQEDPAAGPWGRDETRIYAFERSADGGLVDAAGTLIAETVGSHCDSSGSCWETSGVEDASFWFGDNAWIFNVQSKDALPDCPECVTDGQLLLMKVGGSFGFPEN